MKAEKSFIKTMFNEVDKMREGGTFSLNENEGGLTWPLPKELENWTIEENESSTRACMTSICEGSKLY
jgi:hypothetical protein